MDEPQWSPGTGLIRVVRHLAMRAFVDALVWAGVLVLGKPALDYATSHWAGLAPTALVMIVPGILIAHSLSSQLNDVAGMVDKTVTLLAVLFGWATVVGGVLLATWLRDYGEWLQWICLFATGVSCTAWTIKLTWVER